MTNALWWLWILIQENVRLVRAARRYSASYYARIHDDSWFRLKSEAYMRQKGRCAMCGNFATLHLHHLNYNHLWHEVVGEDVVGVCPDCHPAADKARKYGTPLLPGTIPHDRRAS